MVFHGQCAAGFAFAQPRRVDRAPRHWRQLIPERFSLTARSRDPGLGKPASRYPSGIRPFPVDPFPDPIVRSSSIPITCPPAATIGGPAARGWFCSGSFPLNLVQGLRSHNHDVWIARHVAGGSSSLSARFRTTRSSDPGLGKPASRYPSGIRPFPGGLCPDPDRPIIIHSYKRALLRRR